MKKTLILALVLCAALSLSPVAAEQMPQEIPAATEETAAVNISDATLTLVPGKTAPLAVLGTSAKVEWSTSDKKVATVKKDGTVTGRAAGTAVITAATEVNGKAVALTCEVTVMQPAKSISLSVRRMDNCYVGQMVDMPKVKVSPSNASVADVTWSSSDEAVAVVTEDGKLSIVGPGTAKVTAVSTQPFDNKPQASFYVTATRLVSSVTLDQEEISIGVGNDLKLNVTVLPQDATDTSVGWYSSDTSVVAVDGSGNVHGTGAGMAIVTCKAKDDSEIKAQCVVKVIIQASSISSTISNPVVLSEGISRTLTVSILPVKASPDVTWTSADTTVATVAEDGVLTAVASGKTTVTAATKDGSGLSHTFEVVVEPANPIVIKDISKEKKKTDEDECLYIQPMNVSASRTVKSFRFTVSLEDVSGLITERYICEWSREGNSIKPGKEADNTFLHWPRLTGLTTAARVGITVTRVVFEDGTMESIPAEKQVTAWFE